LQDRWADMIFPEPPPSGEAFEQAISRCHRPGQERDVNVLVCQHTAAFRRNFDKARERAAFLERSQGRQRLNLATEVL